MNVQSLNGKLLLIQVADAQQYAIHLLVRQAHFFEVAASSSH